MNAVKHDGCTPAATASQAKHDSVVAMLKVLHAHGADFERPTEKGSTPLHLVCQYGNAEAAEFLLAHCGVAADTMRPDGWSAAAAAASRGHLAALKVLRAHGGRLDVPSLDGATPLWCASQEGFVDVVECVPSRCSGRTPLHHEPRADGEGAA